MRRASLRCAGGAGRTGAVLARSRLSLVRPWCETGWVRAVGRGALRSGHAAGSDARDTGCLVGGPCARGADAITIGPVISVRRARASSRDLLHHELVHVRQWRCHGVVGVVTRYLGAYAPGGSGGRATRAPTSGSPSRPRRTGSPGGCWPPRCVSRCPPSRPSCRVPPLSASPPGSARTAPLAFRGPAGAPLEEGTPMPELLRPGTAAPVARAPGRRARRRHPARSPRRSAWSSC